MDNSLKIYEKLGAFYLGRGYDLGERKLLDDLLLYDAKDLVTHAVIVGMTGSGKTGLGIGLLEEAAIDGIPALIIDPKGDMANLLLTFPQLRPEDFAPWVDADDARRHGKTPAEFAADQAELWSNGLASWDQDGERIQRLRDAAEFAVYTPGSDAGLPVSILASFAAPSAGVLEDADLLRDRISSTATSLLALLGIDADPVRSREHILLSTILDQVWRQKRDLDLGGLIQMVQNPPVQQVGVLDLESFFPSEDRFELAMTLNNLLAAPGFSAWLNGAPLDVEKLLYTEQGKPRMAIFSIAHLSDAERMFFVSLLLNQTLSWIRSRPGTNSLRALLYIDEIFGYMPPVAEPPSKKPLLTLLKQARAYGFGVVLATQNPSDLDYKGLSNTGTWMLGRLQTERDKMRVLEGLEGASNEAGGSFDKAQISEILSSVGKRVFLMHNVHESAPVIFQTRWVLSYLAGPMTRQQIKKLMDGYSGDHSGDTGEATPPASAATGQATAAKAPARAAPAGADLPGFSDNAPMLAPQIAQFFLPFSRPATQPVYLPRLLGLARVHFQDKRRDLSADEELVLLLDLREGPVGPDWNEAEQLAIDTDAIEPEMRIPAPFAELPGNAAQSGNYSDWKKSLDDWLYRNRRYELFRSELADEYSRPGESEREFRVRIAEATRERRDQQVQELKDKYEKKIDRLEERIRKSEQVVIREQEQASAAKWQSIISIGATIFSVLFGRKKLSQTTLGKATTAARGVGRATTQSADVQRAEADLQTYQEQLAELEKELEQEVDQIEDRYDPMAEQLQSYQLKPRRVDVQVHSVALAWAPHERTATGELLPLY